jgi:ATP-dependent Clp protease ATP-binding subunit ClpC
MRRTIQREVDDKLSRMLLDGLIQPGQRLTVGVADGQLAFDVGDGDRHCP